MSNNKLNQCFWMQIKMRLAAPLILGNGVSEHTDNDLLIGSDGRPYIPGSSIAGVVKSCIQESEKLPGLQLKKLFGDDIDQHRQSMITFYDGVMEEGTLHEIVTREGIEINKETRTTKNKSKYNYEVLNPGPVFILRMEIILREQFKDVPILQFAANLLDCIKRGELRFGAKTNRGYGRMEFQDVSYDYLEMKDAADMEKYIGFDWSNLSGKVPEKLPESTYHSPYTTIEIPLAVESTLLVRNYFLDNFEVDAEQMQVNGKAVIPGNAWAGVFRHKTEEILMDLLGARAISIKMTEQLFGAEKKNTNRKRSRILFEEAVNESDAGKSQEESDMQFCNLTRNRIDRFTGGVLDTALFSERVAVGGEYTLTIKIRQAKEYEIGLILLVAEEVRHGLTAIGGAGAVGRGTMKQRGEIRLNGKDLTEKECQSYWSALTGRLADGEELWHDSI